MRLGAVFKQLVPHLTDVTDLGDRCLKNLAGPIQFMCQISLLLVLLIHLLCVSADAGNNVGQILLMHLRCHVVSTNTAAARCYAHQVMQQSTIQLAITSNKKQSVSMHACHQRHAPVAHIRQACQKRHRPFAVLKFCTRSIGEPLSALKF